MFVSIDSAIRVWDAKTLEATTINKSQANSKKIAVSPDSKYIVVSKNVVNAIKVVLINLTSNQHSEIEFTVKEPKRNNIRQISALCFSNDSTLVGIGFNTREIFVYTLNREKFYSSTLHIEISHISFISNNKLVVAGESEGEIITIDLIHCRQGLLQCWSTLYGNTIHDLKVSHDEKYLGICCDKNVCIYNLSNKSIKSAKVIDNSEDDYPTSIAFRSCCPGNVFVGTNKGKIMFCNDMNMEFNFFPLKQRKEAKIMKIGFISLSRLCVHQDYEKLFVIDIDKNNYPIREIDNIPSCVDIPNAKLKPYSIRSISKRASVIAKPKLEKKNSNLFFSNKDSDDETDFLDFDDSDEYIKPKKHQEHLIEQHVLKNNYQMQPAKPINKQNSNQNQSTDEEHHQAYQDYSKDKQDQFQIIQEMLDTRLQSIAEELHHHINTVHLDLICRIKKLSDKIEILESRK